MPEPGEALDTAGPGRREAEAAPGAAASSRYEGIHAHDEAERARRSYVVWVQLVAALGAPVWLVCLWPTWPSAVTRRLILALWALSALVAVGSLVTEWRWRRRLARPASPRVR